MTSPHHESVEETFEARMSASIFGPDMPPPNYPHNYLDSSSQMPPPNYPPNYPHNYQRRDQILHLNYQHPPQTHAPYYTSNDPNAYIPQETFQPTPPYAYGGTSSVASSQFSPPIEGTPSTSVTEIQE